MKKLTTIFGVLLLSSAMLVGCGNSTPTEEPATEEVSPEIEEVPAEEPTIEEEVPVEEPTTEEVPAEEPAIEEGVPVEDVVPN